MLRRIAIILSTTPQLGSTSAIVHLENVATQEPLAVPRGDILLTLECEPGASFTRGHVHLLVDHISYPIQSNVALFDALLRYTTPTNSTE